MTNHVYKGTSIGVEEGGGWRHLHLLPLPFTAYLHLVQCNWESRSFKKGHTLSLHFLWFIKHWKIKLLFRNIKQSGISREKSYQKADIEHSNSEGPGLLAVSLFTINKVGDLRRLMGLLIGVYASRQDLVSDNLGLLCIDKCRLVVSCWSLLKSGERGLWALQGWGELKHCLFRILPKSSRTLARVAEVKFPKDLLSFVEVSVWWKTK